MAARGTERKRRPADDPTARILDAALVQAGEVGWSRLRLSDVAARLEISLAEIQRHYRDKDAVADALFRRAWQAMLSAPPDGLAELPMVGRLHLLLMRWFDALAPHRAVAGQMLTEKLYPSHPHHWAPLIFNLSRTIHWLLDAAGDESGGRRRQIVEIGLTGIFLATLRVWSRDDSEGQSRTRESLKRRLEAADRKLAGLCRRGGARPSGGAGSEPADQAPG